jgi:hypothetical protein
MVESPMTELLDVKPVHLVSRPGVPLPTTWRFAAAGARATAGVPTLAVLTKPGVSTKPARVIGGRCAKEIVASVLFAVSAEVAVLFAEVGC